MEQVAAGYPRHRTELNLFIDCTISWYSASGRSVSTYIWKHVAYSQRDKDGTNRLCDKHGRHHSKVAKEPFQQRFSKTCGNAHAQIFSAVTCKPMLNT